MTAIVLFAEAVGIVLVNGVLATVADNQSMSLAGMDPDAMVTGTWVMGGVSGVLLVVCGLIPLLAGIRDRAPGRFGRITLIVCAVVHGVLGALAVGLIGWAAFAFLMVVLALIVLTLVAYERPAPVAGKAGSEGAPAPV
ncbi:phosphotransferase system glucose/maltose/N-acetylglucosamine-specific IIC component [Streptomyces sp. HB132]|nr:phosphotransferase system glucose/maltose/N-acetylglucosamine-specific IIC component [Streptomyces sp. HB132]